VTAAPAVSFDTLLLRIGRLNYTWTNTESLLIHVIAGLCRTDKESAMIVFLTLNTTRARVDLIERLAKLERTEAGERERVLAATRRLSRLAALRNRYNHCIYSFDPESGATRTILMRIADRKDRIKVGEMTDIDAAAIADIEQALADLAALNADIWALIRELDYPL
jgi:hypothetical protein